MSLVKKINKSTFIKSLILAGMITSQNAYSADNTQEIYDKVAQQEREISRLNEQIKMMMQHQKQQINELNEKFNQLSKKNLSNMSAIQNNVSSNKLPVELVNIQLVKAKTVSTTEKNKNHKKSAQNTTLATKKNNYVEDASTPESERINVAPEELFKAKFEKKFEPSTNPSETYLKALQAFSVDDTETAVTEFKRYLQYHSDHNLVVKAHYWLGMSYIKQKPANYSAARFQFMEVVNRFADHPNNDKRKKALYRLAQLSKINNYTTDVQKYFNMLNRDFPDSKETKLAKKLLKNNE